MRQKPGIVWEWVASWNVRDWIAALTLACTIIYSWATIKLDLVEEAHKQTLQDARTERIERFLSSRYPEYWQIVKLQN